MLKSQYKSNLQNVEHREALENASCSSFHYVPRQEAYVNLTLSDVRGSDNTAFSSDSMFNLHNQFKSYEPINFEDVIQDNDRFVALRGIGGVGKTTFCETFVFKWSENEILQNIKLLFLIKCREMGEITNLKFEDLLKEKFAAIIETIPIETLNEIGDQIVILLDGVDELDKPSILHICEMIKIDKLLNSFKICITGRPNAIQATLVSLRKSIHTKLIDVMGFTMQNITIYINKFYENYSDKEVKISKMLQKLKESLELKSIATIPAYLWIICSIIDDKCTMELPKSNTTIFLLATLVIIREQYKSLTLSEEDLYSISQKEEVLSLFLKLAELSFISLRDGKIILYEQDLGENSRDIEECGFLLRYVSSKGKTFQFRHLIFSEFLCGFYLFLIGDKGYQYLYKSDESSPLLNSLPTFLALHQRFKTTVTEEIFDQFLTKLVKYYNKHKTKPFALSNRFKPFRRAIPNSIHLIKKLFKQLTSYNAGVVPIDQSWMLLLTSLYECKLEPPSCLIDLLSTAQIDIHIVSHHQLQCVAYLFQTIQNIKNTCRIFIYTSDNCTTNYELRMLQKLLVKSKEIFMDSYFDSNLFLELTKKSNTQFHNLRTLSLFSHCSCVNELMKFIPYLTKFEVDCIVLPIESAEILSNSIIKAKTVDKINSLRSVSIHNCKDGELLNKLIPCTSFLSTFYLYKGKITIDDVKKLTQSLKDNVTARKLSLGLFSCQLGNDHIKELAPSIPYLGMLDLSGNPGITARGYQIITDTILQEVQINKQFKLRKLNFSHLNDDHLSIIAPIIPHLRAMRIMRSDGITVKSFQKIQRFLFNRAEKFRLQLDNEIPINIGINEVEIATSLADVEKYVTIDYGQCPFDIDL